MSRKKMPEKEKLSAGVPVRLFPTDYESLQEYEKQGLEMSDIIRRCVRKSLPEVAREIQDGIGRIASKRQT